MAETIDEMKAFVAAYEEMKKAISDSSATDKMKATFQSMGPIAEAFKKKIMEGTGAVGALTAAASQVNMAAFSTGLGSVGSKITTFMKSIDLSKDNLQKLGVEIGAIYALASGKIGMSDELMRLGNAADGTTAQMSGMFDRISNIAPGLLKALGPIGPMIRKTFQQVDAVKKMETGLLMNAAAAGNLDAAMGSIGDTMTNLSDMTIDFSRLTSEAGTSNNMTAGQAANYASQLMRIPGALSQVIDATADGQTQMSMLDATIKVAAGTFQPFEDVMKDVDLLFKNWNKTGKDSLDFVAKMSAAAQSLKMPMDLMRGYVHSVGEQFKFLGDNTGGAIDIMTRFEPAFQASGLGPAAITELVQGMTGAVSQMDVAQRGFVSARTGGPGGLQGGYEIAQQMAEGDMSGVFGKVEDTLKGMFGGQVVTLKQASQDARAAAQFTKQVQMLTTGPLKIANTEAEAFKILDAFAAGTMPEIGAEGAAEDPMQKAMSRGNEIQDRQFNELVAINNQLEHYGTLAADIAASRLREGIGPGSDAGQERWRRMRGTRDEATAKAAQRRFQEERPAQGRAGEIRGVAEGVGDLINKAGAAFEGAIGGGAVPKQPLEGEKETKPLFAEDRTRQFGGYAGMGERPQTKEDINREVNRQAGTKPLFEKRVRQDMAVGRETEERARGERGERGEVGAGKGGKVESTIVVQVRSDKEIKNLFEGFIDEHGAVKAYK